jgi:hypothetical protein
MKRYVTAGLLLVSLATPALAESLAARDAQDTAPNYSYDAKRHYAVEDTVGNCAVLDATPSADLKILGDRSGYDSVKAAQQAFGSKCKGEVPRYST